MFVDKNSVKINNVSMGPYLVEVKYGFNKLWGEDSGRNLNGDMIASLVGVFPKLTMQFRKLTKSELHALAPIFDSERQTVKYHDPTENATVTLTTYSSDWEVINRNIINEQTKNEGFTISFISCYKR